MTIGTSVQKLMFSLLLTLAVACSTASQMSTVSASLPEDMGRGSGWRYTNPDIGTFGRGAVCMVHKAAQEASRRTTPARAVAHAVASPLDRTFDSPVTTAETATVTRL
jgi:hypothetical protein